MTFFEVIAKYQWRLVMTPKTVLFVKDIRGVRRDDGLMDSEMVLEYPPSPIQPEDSSISILRTEGPQSMMTFEKVYGVGGSLNDLLADGWVKNVNKSNERYIHLERIQ